MKFAYSLEQQKMITIQEAMYPDFYGVIICPECQGILSIRKKGKRPCFAHEPTEEECRNRISWTQKDETFPSDLPKERYQHYSLLRHRLLDILYKYSTEGKYSYKVKKNAKNINHSIITQDSENMLLVLSHRSLEGLIYTKIYYGFAQIEGKIKEKSHHTFVWDILITFIMYSKNFSALEALEILISASDSYPKISSDKLKDLLNTKPFLGGICNYSKYNVPRFKEYFKAFSEYSESSKYCIDVIDFVLGTFFYIDWQEILKDWVMENPAILNY